MFKVVLVMLSLVVVGCSKAKMQVVNEPVEATPPPTVVPVCPSIPKIQLYECKDKHGKLILQVYATNILKHSCSKSLKCEIKK